MTTTWKEPGNYDSIILTKSNNETMTLSVGDFITWQGRPDGVKITYFTHKESDPRGPIGMCYLPWRSEGKRWATEVWTLKGNARHIIAFPAGTDHYGEQLDWNLIQFKDSGICPTEIPALPPSP